MPAKVASAVPLPESPRLQGLQSFIQDTSTELAIERDYAAHQAARGRHREARATLRKVASLEAWLAYLQGEFARVLADGQEAA